MTVIIIITFNTPSEVLKLQLANIKKFCKDDFVIEVIDNSRTRHDMTKEIALPYGNYTRTELPKRDASNSHGAACDFAYKLLKDKYDTFLFLDHDCIPVKDFSVVEILGDKQLGGVLQGVSDTKYLWVGCLMLKRFEEIDFMPDETKRIDTGGGTWKIMNGTNTVLFSERGVNNPKFQHGMYHFYTMICDETFMHFLNTSNWNRNKRNTERINTLIEICTQL